MAVGPIEGIDRELIDSSNIAAIGYDGKDILAIEFKSGDVFHYKPVTLELMAAFYAALSKGTFYSKQIKGKIPARLMTGVCLGCSEVAVLGFACPDCGGKVGERVRRRLTPEEKGIEAREGKR